MNEKRKETTPNTNRPKAENRSSPKIIVNDSKNKNGAKETLRQSRPPAPVSNFGREPERQMPPKRQMPPERRTMPERQMSPERRTMPERQMSPEQKRRLEQRKANIKKAKRRRNRIVFSVLLAISVIVFICLSLTVLFKINDFSVSGETRYSVEQIKSATGIQTDTVNLFRCNLEETGQKITRTLPYIGNVKITRRLPSTLVISVEETTPKLAAEYGNEFLILDKNGKILESSSKSDKLIILKCPAAKDAITGNIISFEDEKILTNLKTTLEAIEKSEIADITQINVVENAETFLLYQDRITLKIGSTLEIDAKLKLAISSLKNENEISKDEKGVLDLTIKGKAYFSVTRDEDTQKKQ